MAAAAARGGVARGKAARERARQDEARRRSNERFAELHPARAREERALRKQQAEVAERFGRNDFAAATPETRYHASRVRQGALARLYASGALSADQLAWALEIAAAAQRIGADAAIGTVSLETRVDTSRDGGRRFWESLGQVRAEVAYTAWRGAALALSPRGSRSAVAPLLALIVEDCGIEAAATRFGMARRTLRKLLSDALDLWPGCCRDAWRSVDEADVEAARAGLL